jgi:toxin ParE1/3/4
MIVWTEQATRQLDQVHDYIALSNSQEIASRVTLHIASGVQLLASFPTSGKAGRVRGTRELVISDTPFVVAYILERERIRVLAIYHRARQWPDVFLSPDSKRPWSAIL